MKEKYVLLFCIILFPFLAICQDKKSQTFFTGYNLWPGDDSNNNMFVSVVDTGLVFSEKIVTDIDFGFSQSYTYCDENGEPLLIWQGCTMLDAKTLLPIVDGYYDQGFGTSACLPDPIFPGQSIGDVPYNFGSFMVNNHHKSNELILYYYRSGGLLIYDSVYLNISTINLNGPNGNPIVEIKDSLVAGNVRIQLGSQQVIKHANGIDWFYVFQEFGTNNWCSILHDENGFGSIIRSNVAEWDFPELKIGGMSAISPDGSKYIFHANRNKFVILNFDRCSGLFSYWNSDRISDAPEVGQFSEGNIHFAEFSPNGRFAYISNELCIHQYDLEDENFLGSDIVIARFDTSKPKPLPVAGFFSQPFRGINGEIYYWSGNSQKLIHRMQFPNEKGPNVGFTQGYYQTPIYLPWFTQNFVDYAMKPLPDPCELNVDIINTGLIRFHPNPTNDLIKAEFWDNYNNKNATILDITGRKIWQGRSEFLKDGIRMGQYQSGIYHVLFDGKFVGRFVKI